MAVEKKKITHDVISNLFYYLFLVLIVVITILSLVLEIELINSIFIISLIITSLVIIFYIAFQMLRYNFTIEKKVQLGILLVVVGFVLVLTSLSKDVNFGDNFLSDFLGETHYIYWGIGSIAIGVFIELTLFDQMFWNLIVTPLKYMWRALVAIVKFIREHWKPILLYSLDFISIALIITFSARWDWLGYYSWIPVGAGIIYLMTHHARRIWRVVRFIALRIFYRLIVNIGKTIRWMAIGIWNLIVRIFKFFIDHWWVITKEILRLVGVGAGIFFIVWGVSDLSYPIVAAHFNEFHFLWIGLAVILISEIFSRKRIIVGVYNGFISLMKFIGKSLKRLIIEIGLFFYRSFRYILVSIKRMFIRIWEFIKVHYKRILLEILRLAIVVASIILMVYTYLPISAGVIVIITVELLIRRIVLNFLRRILVKILQIFKNLLIAIKEFFVKHYLRILEELARLVVCAVGIFFIVWAWSDLTFPAVATNFNETNFAWIGFASIILIQFVLRRFFLKPIFEFVKQLSIAFWEIIKTIFYKPFKFIVLKTYALFKFLVKHRVKVLLYTLDLAAIIAIIFFSIRWDLLELLTIAILVGCSGYLIGHHYRSIWKVIKFIAVDIFYRFFRGIYRLFKFILTKIWNAIKSVFKFIADHWLRILKEFIRLLGVAVGIYLIYHGYNIAPIETERIYTIIGIILIPVSLIFSRVAVWKAIFRGIKRFVKAVIKWFENVFETLWLTIKTFTHYVATNFLRLLLLLFMIFTFISGIAVMAGFRFWGLFEEALPVPYRLSIGGILLVVAIGSLFLFRRQLGKLRTGETRILFREIKEAWKK